MDFRGDRLKALRKLRGTGRQDKLARALGIKQPLLSKWECGTAEPDFGQAKRLATLLECTLDFLGGIGEFKNIDPRDERQLRAAASTMAFAYFEEEESEKEGGISAER